VVDANVRARGIDPQHRDRGRPAAAVGIAAQHRELEPGPQRLPARAGNAPGENDRRDQHRSEGRDASDRKTAPGHDAGL
jgi:hypothetical protein